MVSEMSAWPGESADTESPEPRPVKKCRIDADANHRRSVVDRGGRRVIVSRRGCAVRLNHLGAGIRAQSRSKPECEHRQCYHNKFSSHYRYSSCCPADLTRRSARSCPRKWRRSESPRNAAAEDVENTQNSIRSWQEGNAPGGRVQPMIVKVASPSRERRYFLSSSDRYAS